MKNILVISKTISRIAIAILVGAIISSCSNDSTFDNQPVNSLDFCVEREDYHISRSMISVEPTEEINNERAGVWVRKSSNPLAWSIDNSQLDFAGGMWSSVVCDEIMVDEGIEAFAYRPYSAERTIIAEAFENRATGTNIAGLYYKVSPDAGDLSVGAAVTASSDVMLRLKPVLAKVGFTVSVNVDGQVRKITAAADGKQGSFDLGDGNILNINTVSLSGHFYGEGVVNMMSCNWAVPDRSGRVLTGNDYIGGASVENGYIDNFILSSDDFNSVDTMGGEAVEHAELNNGKSYIYLIPQECVGNNAVKFEVEYTLINPSGCALTFTESSPSMELAFEAGESQLFDIAFDFSTISFNPTTTSWR